MFESSIGVGSAVPAGERVEFIAVVAQSFRDVFLVHGWDRKADINFPRFHDGV